MSKYIINMNYYNITSTWRWIIALNRVALHGLKFFSFLMWIWFNLKLKLWLLHNVDTVHVNYNCDINDDVQIVFSIKFSDQSKLQSDVWTMIQSVRIHLSSDVTIKYMIAWITIEVNESQN